MFPQLASRVTMQHGHPNPPSFDNSMRNYIVQATCVANNEINASTLMSSHDSVLNGLSAEAVSGYLPSPTGLSTSTFAIEDSWDISSPVEVDNNIEDPIDCKSVRNIRSFSYDSNQLQSPFT